MLTKWFWDPQPLDRLEYGGTFTRKAGRATPMVVGEFGERAYRPTRCS
jgi:hypothetical protein